MREELKNAGAWDRTRDLKIFSLTLYPTELHRLVETLCNQPMEIFLILHGHKTNRANFDCIPYCFLRLLFDTLLLEFLDDHIKKTKQNKDK